MIPVEILGGLSDVLALALTMWAEARGDAADGSSLEERVAVGCVIRNRVRASGMKQTYRDVCLAPKQFSCWNDGPADANQTALIVVALTAVRKQPLEPTFQECLFLAHGIMAGDLLDRTGGAREYYAPAAMIPPGRIPTWAQGKPGRKIGSQIFLAA